jgi:hypothetical protein
MFRSVSTKTSKLLIVLATVVLLACNTDLVEPATAPKRIDVRGLRGTVVINPSQGDQFQRGIFYFSGWSPKYFGWYFGTEVPEPDPWRSIKTQHEAYDPTGPSGRTPWLGWYDEDNQDVVNDQILAMHDAGYKFVAYQIGWSHDAWHKDPIGFHDGAPRDSSFMDHMVKRHLTSQYRPQLQFAITWADVMSNVYNNRDSACVTQYDWCYWRKQHTDNGWTLTTYQADIVAMTRYWFSQWIVNNPDYYKKNGMPVIFIFSPEVLIQPSAIFGTTIRATTDLIKATAAEFGYTPFLVAVNVGDSYLSSLMGWGFDAVTAYRYTPGTISFQEGIAGSGFNTGGIMPTYRNRWNSDLDSAQRQGIKYFVPNLSRHDGRAWGLSPAWNPAPLQFKVFVDSSAIFALAHSTQTDKTIMTCCWNEWGEGAFMERSSKAPSQDVGGTNFADEHRHSILGDVNQTPGGNVDGVLNLNQLDGWAVDFDAPSQRVEVSIWMDLWVYYPTPPHRVLTQVGATQTYDDSGDVNAAFGGLLGNHRFHFDLPCVTYPTTIYVKGRDTGTGAWYPIGANGAAGTAYGPNC